MKAIKTAICACLLLGMPYGVFSGPAFSQATSRASICDTYARDFARRNSRGPIAAGATIGAVGGAIVGGIFGGPVGVTAALGGGIGGTVGAGARAQDFNALYNRAFSECMRM
jgi:hypothetical protein